MNERPSEPLQPFWGAWDSWPENEDCALPYWPPPDTPRSPPVRISSPVSAGVETQTAEQPNRDLVFNYRVKIVNPERRSDFVIREIHEYKERFESLSAIRMKLMDEFPTQVPSSMDFQLGYFVGKQSSKHWLMCQADLESMYKTLDGRTSVLLWCDGRATDKKSGKETSKSRKRKGSTPSPPHATKRQAIETEVDETVGKLKDKHGSQYSLPQLRLWARMITAGNHDSIDNPPQTPAITGIIPKREKRESLSSALAGAAVTFASALRSPGASVNNVVITDSPSKTKATSIASEQSLLIGLSPGRVTELRRRKIQELRELQQLLDENILTTPEFNEQKELVLNSLRKLTH